MKERQTYCWMEENEVSVFMKAFIIKASELDFHPETIGKYLALALDGIVEAQKEREIKEDNNE